MIRQRIMNAERREENEEERQDNGSEGERERQGKLVESLNLMGGMPLIVPVGASNTSSSLNLMYQDPIQMN